MKIANYLGRKNLEKVKINLLFVLFFTTIEGLWLPFNGKLFAQKVAIELGQQEIALNEVFTITITCQDQPISSYSYFPDLAGFEKKSLSAATGEQFVKGSKVKTYLLAQHYAPMREGEFRLKPFTMLVNGKQVETSGLTIRVTQSDPNKIDSKVINLDDFFKTEEKNVIETKEDVFFGLTTNKNEVFLGEGFNLTIALYVASDNTIKLKFTELGDQLSDILRKVRPANCWEEDFNISEIQKNEVQINNKTYTQYKIYQANFYPLNTNTVTLPEVGLKMLRESTGKKGEDDAKKDDESLSKTYVSTAKSIKVKELPKHPLKDQVAVGNFTLQENITKVRMQTGENIRYQLTLVGDGNIANIQNPEIPENNALDFYLLETKTTASREGGQMVNGKVFSYHIFVKEAGKHALKDYFKWIHFNTKTKQYDTLSSNLVLEITGESLKDLEISSSNIGDFYRQIITENNRLNDNQFNTILGYIVSFVIISLVLLVTAFTFRKL